MRYLFLMLPIIFAFPSLGYAEDMEDDSEVVEEISESEENNEQNYNDQEDSDEKNEEEADVRQSASARSKRENVSVYGDSSQQKFKENQQRRARTDQSDDASSIRRDDGTKKVKIVQHKARFDPVTHEIIIETEPVEPPYLNKVDSVEQELPTETESFEYRDPEESSHNITHEFIIETEPFEPRYLNGEYWAEHGKDEEENFSKEETSDSKESESNVNKEEADTNDYDD